MKKFSGFPSGRVRFTQLPAQFFSELLPVVDHLGELKVLLYAFWRVGRMEGNFRYLQLKDFSGDKQFMQGMALEGKTAMAYLLESLAKAVTDGALLKADVDLPSGQTSIYLINTVLGTAAVEAISQGNWQPSGNPDFPIALELEKPNVFQLYEEHIGPLTPMIADTLQDAEKEYSAEWIEAAIKEAVVENVRKWRYIEAILKNWKKEAKDARANRQDTEKDFRRYGKGKYGQILKKRETPDE